MQAVALGKPVPANVAAKAFEAGLLLNAPRPDSLRFMPSLTVAEGEIAQKTVILEEILGNMNGGT